MDQEQRKYDDNLQEGKSENYQELQAKKKSSNVYKSVR